MPHLTSTTLSLLPRSLVSSAQAEYGLAQTPAGLRLVVLAATGSLALTCYEGESAEFRGRTLLTGPLSSQNAAALRGQLPWLQPRLLGLRTSAGMGDRLGLATAGHVRATRAVGGKVEPIFAQQSIREMARTRRTPQHAASDG